MVADAERRLLYGLLAIHLHMLRPVDYPYFIAISLSHPERSLETILQEDFAFSASRVEVLHRACQAKQVSTGGDILAAVMETAQLLREIGEHDDDGTRQTLENSAAPSDVTSPTVDITKVPPGKRDYYTQLSPLTNRELHYRPLHNATELTIEHKGRYEFEREFGRGGIGRVMLAFDRHLGREVAIKELLPLFQQTLKLETGEFLHQTTVATVRFLKEARITGQLEHPGIVPVYELGQRNDGTLYYVMKLVRGTTLGARIREAATLPERLELLPHYLDVCQALAYAHSRGVIHRDLKPDNIMIGEFGETILLDWGLAKVKDIRDDREQGLAAEMDLFHQSETMTMQGVALGTPAYMSPEQAAGRIAEVDERSDVWGLGVILFQLISGRLPFEGKNALQIVRNVLTQTPLVLEYVSPKAPPELAAVVAKCLQKGPRERYANAGELATEIQRFLSGGLLSVFTYSPLMLIKRWVRKHKAVTVTTLVSLIVLLIGSVWSYIEITRQRDDAMAARLLAEEREREVRESFSEALSEKALAATNDAKWAEAKIFMAGALLNKERSDARLWLNYEAQLPVRLDGVEIRSHHNGFAIAADISPDEHFAVSGGFDGTVLLLDLMTSGEKKLQDLPGGWISSLVFSADGTLLAGANEKGLVRVWNFPGCDIRWQIDPAMHVRCLAFSPRGDLLAAGAAQEVDGPILLFDTLSGLLVHQWIAHGNRVTGLAFSPDGQRLYSSSEDGSAKVWDTRSRALIKKLPGTRGWISAICVSPDGRSIAVGGSENFVQIYNAETMEEIIRMPGHSGEIFSLRYTKKGDMLVSASFDATVRIWDTRRFFPLFTLTGHRSGVFQAIPFAGGTRILSSGNDSHVRLWALQRQPLSEYRLTDKRGNNRITIVRYLDGTQGLLAASYNGCVYHVRRDSGAVREFAGHEGQIEVLAVSPDEQIYVSGSIDATLVVRSIESGDILVRRDLGVTHEIPSHIQVFPDNQTVLIGLHSGRLETWNYQTGETRDITTFEPGRTFGFILDGGRCGIAIGGGEHYIRRWVSATGEVTSAPGTLSVTIYGATLSPDERLMAVCLDDQTILIIDIATMETVNSFHEHNGEIFHTTFSPDGTTLATASYDQHIRFFDTTNWRQLFVFRPDISPVMSTIVFSRDGTEIAWGSTSGSVRLLKFLPEYQSIGPMSVLKRSQASSGYILDRTRLISSLSR